jgi:hypothetical protein
VTDLLFASGWFISSTRANVMARSLSQTCVPLCPPLERGVGLGLTAHDVEYASLAQALFGSSKTD